MVLRVFNTIDGKLEEFRPLLDTHVGMYVCGPTVYDWTHMGHARTYLAFDVIVRWLKFKGFSVFYVQNITDVGHLTEDSAEDKIAKKAKEKRIEPMQLVEFYMREYLKDLDLLGVERPDISPRATGHLIEIIEAVESLIKKEYAYEVNGNVFFDVSKFEDYGMLSKIKPKAMLAGSRFEIHPDKRNPQDFALWKKAEKNALLKWWSPWGYGFPGWHIECAIMGLKYLGSQLDIHGGARDLVFPHHENEIAQCEALTGKKPFVKYWLHTGFLTISGEKMAKSLGNYVTVREALEKYEAEAIRLFVLSAHYRSEINFTDKRLRAAEAGLRRLYNTISSLEEAMEHSVKRKLTEAEKKIKKKVEKLEFEFVEAMDEDFNTPQAIATLFELSREINRFLGEQKQASIELLKEIYEALLEKGKVLGLFQRERIKKPSEKLVNDLVKLLVELRENLRRKGDFELSDGIRAKLRESGVVLEDTSEGCKWKLT
ncbi:MAG: cysteine--tRNA ligase [Candidatus Bathyarchaeota archaeon]|nr:MAG: cysteine--tRNA ligase [Candidatus Bathyarchaeota archaeon]